MTVGVERLNLESAAAALDRDPGLETGLLLLRHDRRAAYVDPIDRTFQLATFVAPFQLA